MNIECLLLARPKVILLMRAKAKIQTRLTPKGIISNFFFLTFIPFLRDRERQCEQREDRERYTHRIQSRLQARAISTEPDTGLKLTSREIVT